MHKGFPQGVHCSSPYGCLVGARVLEGLRESPQLECWKACEVLTARVLEGLVRESQPRC